jgi:Tfp pilus assembly protein PilF
MARGEWGLAAELLYREIGAADSPVDCAALYLELAMIYDEKLGDAGQARVNYEQALLLDPEIPAAPRPLARLYAAIGRAADAARMYERAAGFAAGEVERGRLLRLAAQAAEQAGLEGEVQRLHELAASAVDDGTAPSAPLAGLAAGARIEALEERLRLTGDAEEQDALRRQILALAIEVGDKDVVERHARALVAVNQADMSAYTSLTSEASERGNWPAMASLLIARIDAAPTPAARAGLRVELGRVYQRELDAPAEATRAFELALLDQPGHPEALEALAELCYARQDWLRARELFERIDPETATLPADVIHLRRGEIAEVLGNDDEACAAFARAVELFPASRQALTALARTALRIGDVARAHAASRALLELLPPDDVRAVRAARLQLAELSQRVRDLDGAVRCYEQVLAEEPRSITALTSLIALHGERGDQPASARVLRQLIALTPAPSQRADMLYRLGEIHRRLGDDDEAADCYLKAIDLDPDHVPTLRRLVDVFWGQGDDKSLLEVARDLEERGALLDASSSTATLAHVMIVAALRGDVELAARVAGFLGPAAELALGAAAGDLVCRADAPRLDDVVAAMLDLANRAGMDRRSLRAGLMSRAMEDDAVKPLLDEFKKS